MLVGACGASCELRVGGGGEGKGERRLLEAGC